MKTPYSILLAGLLLAAAPAFAANPIDVSRPADAHATVQINNLAGSIKIVGWNKNSVHVSGMLGNSDQHLKVSGDKNNIDIRVIYPNSNWSGGYGQYRMRGTDLVVQVPQGATVQAESVSARISAGGVSGTQRLQSVSGDITVTSKAADINAQTVSGDIEATGSAADAHVELDTVSGDAHAFDITGELTGQTVSGNVIVARSKLRRAHLNATSGRVEFNAPIEDNGDYKFNTVSGEVEINLPKQSNAEFDITTFSGSIDNNFGPKPKKASPYTPSLKLHFTSGKGGAYVNANSMSGSITLKAGS